MPLFRFCFCFPQTSPSILVSLDSFLLSTETNITHLKSLNFRGAENLFVNVFQIKFCKSTNPTRKTWKLRAYVPCEWNYLVPSL